MRKKNLPGITSIKTQWVSLCSSSKSVLQRQKRRNCHMMTHEPNMSYDGSWAKHGSCVNANIVSPNYSISISKAEQKNSCEILENCYQSILAALWQVRLTNLTQHQWSSSPGVVNVTLSAGAGCQCYRPIGLGPESPWVNVTPPD